MSGGRGENTGGGRTFSVKSVQSCFYQIYKVLRLTIGTTFVRPTTLFCHLLTSIIWCGCSSIIFLMVCFVPSMWRDKQWELFQKPQELKRVVSAVIDWTGGGCMIYFLVVSRAGGRKNKITGKKANLFPRLHYKINFTQKERGKVILWEEPAGRLGGSILKEMADCL